MNLAISNIAWDKNQDEDVYELIKRFGFKGIEIAPTKVWNDPLLQSMDTLNQYENMWRATRKISIVATQSILFGHPDYTIFEDEETRQKTFEYLKKMIVLTSQLGAKVLVFGSPKNRSTGYTETKILNSIAIEFFHHVAEFSKLHNVYFCLEPNSTAYKCSFIVNTKEAVNFIKMVNHPYLQLHLDTGVMCLNNEDYERSIYESFSYLKHMHVSEPYLDKIGKSGIPHKLIAKRLKELNYENWVSIEMVKKDNTNTMHRIKNALRLVSEIYA